MSHFIRAATLSGFEELTRNYLANPVDILKSCGIMTSQLRNPENLISYESCMEALELAAKKCNTPIFGMQLASKQGLETLGLIGAFMSKQPTIKDALLIAQKYVYVHSDAFEVYFDILSESCCEISIVRYDRTYDHYPQKVQLGLGVLYRLMSDLVGSEWGAQSVEFVYPMSKSYQDQFEAFFKCPVSFGGKRDVIRFHPKFLAKRPNYTTSLIDQMVIEHFENSQKGTFDLIDQTKATIKSLLSTGDCNKDNVAMCLNLHAKKFERQLREAGTTFRDELEIVRKEEALRMMQEGKMSLTAIALNLGYAEFSVFSRRFKQWFGQSPSQWSPH